MVKDEVVIDYGKHRDWQTELTDGVRQSDPTPKDGKITKKDLQDIADPAALARFVTFAEKQGDTSVRKRVLDQLGTTDATAVPQSGFKLSRSRVETALVYARPEYRTYRALPEDVRRDLKVIYERRYGKDLAPAKLREMETHFEDPVYRIDANKQMVARGLMTPEDAYEDMPQHLKDFYRENLHNGTCEDDLAILKRNFGVPRGRVNSTDPDTETLHKRALEKQSRVLPFVACSSVADGCSPTAQALSAAEQLDPEFVRFNRMQQNFIMGAIKDGATAGEIAKLHSIFRAANDPKNIQDLPITQYQYAEPPADIWKTPPVKVETVFGGSQ